MKQQFANLHWIHPLGIKLPTIPTIKIGGTDSEVDSMLEYRKCQPSFSNFNGESVLTLFVNFKFFRSVP